MCNVTSRCRGFTRGTVEVRLGNTVNSWGLQEDSSRSSALLARPRRDLAHDVS